jgi:hypothetical protein
MLFVNDPPTAEMHCFPIVRPRHRNPLSVVIATREWRGTWTHWYGGKTIACCLPATCEACEGNVKKVWQGHLLGYRLADDVLCMVVFTLAVKQFLVTVQREDKGIFGQSVRMTRMGGRETGPIGCTSLASDYGRDEVRMSALEKVVSRLYADNSNQREVILRS